MTNAKAQWDDDLALALRLADAASAIALAYFGEVVPADTKEDGTPVTEADFAVEAALVDLLLQERPNDGILSEEGASRPDTGRRWILDPIDGTVNFARADPDWGTNVALEAVGEVVVGVVTCPVRRRRWWATSGGGAFTATEGQAPSKLRTSTVADLSNARITLWPPEPSPLLEALHKSGVFVEPGGNAIVKLLAGDLDAVIARGGGAWDHAPAVLLTQEAGGRFRDPEGGQRLDLGGGTYSNGYIDSGLRVFLA
jgi:histidinol-phosphatase